MNYFAIGLDLVPENGGPTKSVPNFARALGGRAVSFTYRDKIPSGTNPEITHIRSIGGPLGRSYLVAPPSEIRRLDALTADAQLLSCHILYRHSVHWVISRAKRRGIPYWIVPHGCLDPYVFSYGLPVKRLWMRLFGRRILREAAAVIFSTQREKDKAACWMDRDNGHVVHWPVELPDLAAGEEARVAWRAEQGFTDKDRVLLALGRLHSMKRPLETVEAVAASRRTDLKLVFIGPQGDVSAEEVKGHAEKIGVGRQVRVLKPVYGADKWNSLFGCDAYISLSLRENFNNSAAEALAAGRPVLLSGGNDLIGDLEKTNCGLVFHDVDDGANKIACFADSPAAMHQEWGHKARIFAADFLAFSKFQSKLELIARTTTIKT